MAGQIYINTTAWQTGWCNDANNLTYDNSDNLNTWVQMQSASCTTSLGSGNGEATSAAYAKVNAFTGEFKLSALAYSEFNGNTQGFLTAFMSANLYFEPLVTDTTVTFDLNVEGVLKDDNWSGSQSYIRQTLWFNQPSFTVSNYADRRTWQNNTALTEVFISEVNSFTFNLLAGANSLNFALEYFVGAAAFNTGYGEADFTKTSWMNISFANNTAFTSDIDGFLSNARANIGTQSSTVNEPVTSLLVFISLASLLYSRRLQQKAV